MKRIITSFIMMSLVAVTTWADNVLQYSYNPDFTADVTYAVDNNLTRIYYSGDIVIPDVVIYQEQEYKVTGVKANTFRDNTQVTSVTLGKNLKTIEEYAFSGCDNLTEITIPASVDSIGAWAFYYTGLKNVIIEDGDNILKLWGWSSYGVFDESPLENIYLGRNYITSESRPFGGFYTIKTAIVGDKVTALQDEEFKYDHGLRSVRLGANITDIGNSAFERCDSLYSITLPESVLRIGSNAFYNCESLHSINIPSKVKLIAENAFEYCLNLESIIIPASVDSIGDWAFNYTGLKNVIIEDGDNILKLWGWGYYSVFNGSPLESIYLGRNYITSESRPFRDFPTIKTAIVGDKVTALQDEEFRNDRGLRTVRLGANITDIGNYAFSECDTLYEIRLPESLLCIGEGAFYSCDSLFSINIPSKVNLIAANAFEYCRDLESITIPASVDSIGDWAFNNTGLKNVIIEDGDNILKLWGWGAYSVFNGSPLESIYLGRNYTTSESRPFSGFPTIKTATVGDKVTALQDEEFKYDYGLRTVRLGANIADIGNWAFYECDTLYEIILPESVLRIGEGAFYSCDSLFSINIPSKVSLISASSFEYCRNLESITIPASVDSIGDWAFNNTGLKKVIIEDGDNILKIWGWSDLSVFNQSPLESVYLGRNYISTNRHFRRFSTLKEFYIGSLVETLKDGEFEYCGGLEKIYSYREIPPTCSSNTFSSVDKQSCKIYVPEQSIDLYKNADYWKDFYSIESGVKNISFLQDDAISNGQWFELNGQSIGTPKRGLNILQTIDGNTIKVFIP